MYYVHFSCLKGWSGDYCNIVKEDTDKRTLIVALATVGGLLLVLSIMVVALILHYNKQKRQRGRDSSR